MNLVALKRGGQSPEMIIRMIEMIPDTGTVFSYKGSEMSVEDVKNRLIQLLPKTFDFREFVLNGVGGPKNFELLFKGLTTKSLEHSKECYKDAIERLNKFLQESSMMPTSPEFAQHFQAMGSQHARALATYQFFSDLCTELDRAMVHVAEAKVNIIKNLEKEINIGASQGNPLVENMLTTKSRITEFVETIEELRECMKEYCQLQGLLLSGLSKVPEHYKVSKKRTRNKGHAIENTWVTEYRVVRQSDGKEFFLLSDDYSEWKTNAKKRGAIIDTERK